MDKINLFLLSHPEVREKDRERVSYLKEKKEKGTTKHIPTKWHHLFMMSEYFNLYHLPFDEGKLSELNNCVIYHFPDGTRSTMHDSVESILREHRGEVPIVTRSYDPHPPLKLSEEFMNEWHDLTITYLKSNVDGDRVRFGKWGYDNHLFGTFSPPAEREKLACMVHSNRTEERHNIPAKEYEQYGISIQKTHDTRREIAQHPRVDVYGHGWPADLSGYKGSLIPFDQKYTKLQKYRFNVVTLPAIADDYIDEKILDSFLTLTVPVVLGTSNLDNHIPEQCFIDISGYEDIEALLTHLERMDDREFESYVSSIKSYRKEIFDDFSTRTNYAEPVYEWYNTEYADEQLSYEFDRIDREIRNLTLERSNDYVSEVRRYWDLLSKKLGIE